VQVLLGPSGRVEHDDACDRLIGLVIAILVFCQPAGATIPDGFSDSDGDTHTRRAACGDSQPAWGALASRTVLNNGNHSKSAGEERESASIFRGFVSRLGWAARTGTHMPTRIDDGEYRQHQVEDHGDQGKEDADSGGAGLE